MSSLTALPDILSQAKVNQARAQEAFKATKEARLEMEATAQRTVKRVDEVDPEEMERRAAHLRRQRDLLLMKKKKEQEERLRVFNEKTKAAEDAAEKERVAVAVTALKAETGSATSPSHAEPDLAADERRMAMRLALGHRLKHDLLEQQQARLTATSTSASTLDEQLMEVSKARERAKVEAEEASRRVREAAMQRAKNIERAAMGL